MFIKLPWWCNASWLTHSLKLLIYLIFINAYCLIEKLFSSKPSLKRYWDRCSCLIQRALVSASPGLLWLFIKILYLSQIQGKRISQRIGRPLRFWESKSHGADTVTIVRSISGQKPESGHIRKKIDTKEKQLEDDNLVPRQDLGRAWHLCFLCGYKASPWVSMSFRRGRGQMNWEQTKTVSLAELWVGPSLKAHVEPQLRIHRARFQEYVSQGCRTWED